MVNRRPEPTEELPVIFVPARSRPVDIGSGIFFGAAAGLFAAIGSFVAFCGSVVLVWAITTGPSDGAGAVADPGVAIALIFSLAAIVAAVVGLAAGGIVGGLLAAIRALDGAPWVAASLAALAGVLLGQLILDVEAEGSAALGIEAIVALTVTLFAACGWFAGRWFVHFAD